MNNVQRKETYKLTYNSRMTVGPRSSTFLAVEKASAFEIEAEAFSTVKNVELPLTD